jgi:NTP pyrophosphatase (non-canonical NTP hydrolase)
MTNEKEILQTAIVLYGRQAQMDVAIEECAELINAIQKHRRGRVGDKEVIDEIADVRIMTEQLAIIFGEEEVEARRQYKLARQQARMERDKQPICK